MRKIPFQTAPRSRRFILAACLLQYAFLTPIWATNEKKPTTLEEVFSPFTVGTPPSDAYIGLSKLPNGEIRHYNYGEQKLNEHPSYLYSRDHGFTWKHQQLPHDFPFADNQSPISGEYIRAMHTTNKVYIIRTEGGLDGNRTITKIDDKIAIMLKPPVFAQDGKLIVIAGHRIDRTGALTYTSIDDGKTWRISNQVNAPKHEAGGEHLGVRWNHGAVEPTVIELKDGKLWMIVRTAQDHHYQAFSEDGGLTWGESSPSPFYGTITMPTLFRLEDGRILFFWTNTTPLPEMASATGVWDDVFTNRNATHVAISEDEGKSWRGFRELLLDERRNASDYATVAGIDKSVHQAQAVEVAPGKILASIGQHRLHRKMLLFDVDWIYEKSRFCNFTDSLQQWSTFKYYKGIVGHCGYNRQEGGRLLPHPTKENASVLCLKYEPNDSLVQDNDGALWNFPAAPNGEVKVRLQIPEGAQTVDLLLNDRWFNPTDTVARQKCMYRLPLTRKGLKIKHSNFFTLSIKWSAGGKATVFVDGQRRMTLPLVSPTLHGPSYLHFVGGHIPDSTGILIESVEAIGE
ncbi:MAG: sialidase family protein [Phocaeicola sp.]